VGGRVVVVTGGTKGIGRGIVERFLAGGDDVIALARNAPDELPSANGGEARFLPLDVRDPEGVNALVDKVIEDHGRLDVWVNNAGGSPHAEAAEASPRFHAAIIDLNLTACLHGAQAANRAMQAQDAGGSIVNIASVSGTRPSPGTAAYGAAKAGLLNLTETLAVEWAPRVRVNAVTAGLVATDDAVDHYGGPDGLARVAATVPQGRLGTPADVAAAVWFLCSEEAAFVTGASLAVHGGNEWPAFLRAGRAASDGRPLDEDRGDHS